MGVTSRPLFRMGNAASPRMDHVRAIDVEVELRAGVMWVRAGTGGVSTFDAVGRMRGSWWRLKEGYDYGSLLLVWNDHGSHWSWGPADDMPFEQYRASLAAAGLAFRRLA